jgi:hypothetical protein
MYSFFAIAIVEPYQLVAVHAVEGEHDHDQKVGNQQRGVEPVPGVEVLEGAVTVVRAEIVPESLRLKERQRGSRKRVSSDQGSSLRTRGRESIDCSEKNNAGTSQEIPKENPFS